jgi:RNA polymerase sigma-70 factor, ECF subfamily
VSDGGRSDSQLLRAHVAGDPEAFAELFHRHRDRLWAVAVRTLADREEAADALQDALLSAHRAAAHFRGDSAVTTWLHRIVVNACLDRIRRRQAHPTVPLPDGSRQRDSDRRTGSAEPAAPAPDHDTALVVRQALASLPPNQRTALVLVDVQGYPIAEVAAILGVAEGTVKSRCARGRARLAALLSDLRPAGPAAIRSPAAAPGPGPTPGPPAASRPASPAGRPGPRAVGQVTPGNPERDAAVPSGSGPPGTDAHPEEL